MQGVGGRERYFRTGDIGRGPHLRARPLCGQPGRPCLDTSVGTSGSGGLFQPGQGKVDLFVTGGSWHRNESNKEQFVKPGESDGRPSEF